MGQFDIVAIGSSAGGIKALETILSDLPADFPASILVVQHMDPRHKSLIVEIMQHHCKMCVKEAINDEDIKPSVVYIAPSNMQMLVKDGKILLASTALVHFRRPSIDLMFEFVAANYADRTIGIILSGTGRDGTMGIKAIKEKGGTTIAQDERTSEYWGMPQAAIATGTIDFVLPIQDIAPAIIALIKGDTRR